MGPTLPEKGTPQVNGLSLKFSDGSQTTAELLLGRRDGVALAVAPYTTARGTAIPNRLWMVTEIETRAGQLSIRLGRRFPDSSLG